MNYYEVVVKINGKKERYLVEAEDTGVAEKDVKKLEDFEEVISIKLTKYVDVL